MRVAARAFTVLFGLLLTGSAALGQPSPTADLIVVVDNSGSMSDEVAQLQSSLNSFVADMQPSLDLHVILISADGSHSSGLCVPAPLGGGSCDENLPSFRHVAQAVDSHNALEIVLSTYSEWSGSLRAEAPKFFLVVSDDDSDLAAAAFYAGLVALDTSFSDFMFHGIVAGEPCAGTGNQGTVYLELIAWTGGTLIDLCEGPGVISVGLTSIASAIVDAVGPPSEPPVANAGADAMVMSSLTGSASVTLDGTQSFDPGGESLTYSWTGAFGSAAGATPTVILPIGVHEITLTATDPHGFSGSDTVTITVLDGGAAALASIAAHDASIAALQASVASAMAYIASHDASIAGLQAAISALQAALTAQGTSLGASEERAAALEAQVITLQQAIEGILDHPIWNSLPNAGKK